jgi:hypothetical protein
MSEELAVSVFIVKIKAVQLKASGSSSPTSQAERNVDNSHVAMLAVRVRRESPWL